MNDKDTVLILEPGAFVEKAGNRYTVIEHTSGRVMGSGTTPSRAWHQARMNLFKVSICGVLSEISMKGK